MNILTDSLPGSVEICGNTYPVYTDFRRWVRFELLMSDGNISIEQKSVNLLSLYKEKLPPSINDAIQALLWFFSAGMIVNKDGGNSCNNINPIYSFDYDSEYIYAAFMDQYNIDLIVKIMEYRSIDIDKIKDKGQKAFYRKMKNLYKLPDLRTEAQKEKAVYDSLSVLF